MQFIDLKSQYKHLKARIDKRIQTVLDHGHYILGPEVIEFEEKLADYVGVKHAISCANGTDALQLCMMALGIKPGDAVFCPTFTFFATAEVIALAGATPVFVDSDPDTFNICTVDLEKKINITLQEGKLQARAVIAVDLFGLPANYPKLNEIVKKYNLKLIEDAAQGFGGEINNQRAGSFGDLATTSFFPAKLLGCYGAGGAVFTNNDEYAALIKSIRVHGKGEDKYDNVRVGVNSRLDTIQAAILLEKLLEFPNELIARDILARKYNNDLNGSFIVPNIPDGFKSSWAQYTILSKDREQAISNFKKKGIPTAIYYGKCLHEQTAFTYLGYQKGDFPIAEELSRLVLSLPMHGYFK